MSAGGEAFATIIEAWWAWFAPAAVSGAILGAAAAIADRLLPRGRFLATRNALWLSVIAVLCLPPGLHPVRIPAHPAGAAAGILLAPVEPESRSRVAAGAGLWLAGVAALSVLALLGWRRAARRWSRSEPPPAGFEALLRSVAASAGLRTMPRLRISPAPVGPAVVGGIRPLIVFPAEFLRSGGGCDVEHALLHECLHLRRRDPLAAWAAGLVRILWWFHPAAHLATKRLAALREIGCDQDVARILGDHTASYRRTLVRIAVPSLLPAGAGSMGFFGQRSGIVDRIEALRRTPPRGNRLLRRAAPILGALLIASAVPGRAPPDPVPALLPPGVTWADLQGCLQKRWFVAGLLAQEEAGSGR